MLFELKKEAQSGPPPLSAASTAALISEQLEIFSQVIMFIAHSIKKRRPKNHLFKNNNLTIAAHLVSPLF